MNMEKISCFFATDIIAVSNGVKLVLQSDKITSKEIAVIWNGSVNGIDLDYFDPLHTDVQDIRAAHGIAEDDFVFGFLGRLVGDKGINELVDAFHMISQQHPKIKLLLVGGYENDLDPLSPDTLLTIRTNPHIIEAGIQRDVRSYLKAMNLFVFPSYREGFGIVLMEAAAMNIPGISSDIIGCNEIIEDGINGFLIPVKDKEALLTKMTFALENRGVIDAMSKNTRKIISSKFEQRQLWNKIMEHYKQIKL